MIVFKLGTKRHNKVENVFWILQRFRASAPYIIEEHRSAIFNLQVWQSLKVFFLLKTFNSSIIHISTVKKRYWYDAEQKMWNASRFCVSSLRRGHANLLCIVPILVYVLPKQVHLKQKIYVTCWSHFQNISVARKYFRNDVQMIKVTQIHKCKLI